MNLDLTDEQINVLTDVITSKITAHTSNAVLDDDKNLNKWDGQISERPGFKEKPDLEKLMFSLTNKTVSNKWRLPKRTGRIMNILRNTNYTYLETVVASVIDAALEGNMAAAKLVLSLTCKEANQNEENALEGEKLPFNDVP